MKVNNVDINFSQIDDIKAEPNLNIETLIKRIQKLNLYEEKDLQDFCINTLRKRNYPLVKFNVIKEYDNKISPIYFASFIVHDMSHQLKEYENSENILISLNFNGLTIWKIQDNMYSIIECIEFPQMSLLINSYIEKYIHKV